MNAWTYIAIYGVSIGLPMMIVIFKEDRPRTFYYLFTLGLSLSIPTTFKTIYQDPRPFMTSSTISALACDSDFGNPSFDLFLAMFLPWVAWLDLNAEGILAAREGRDTWINSWANRLGVLLFIVVGMLVSMSVTRMVLGIAGID